MVTQVAAGWGPCTSASAAIVATTYSMKNLLRGNLFPTAEMKSRQAWEVRAFSF